MSLANEVLTGNRLALARAMSQIENGTSLGRQVLDELFVHTGKAHLIGVTGSPGTGKSSLVNRIALAYRQQEILPAKRVGIVAIDPSSPFSGGAILGDRVRMRDLAGDPGVFIRSMASRGSLGGIAAATSGVVQALDAAGFEVVLIETVGAGQAEVEIAHLAHTTLVVEAPGLGDDIQAIKAGILEIADILVINKADQPGVEATERALRSMLQLAHPLPHVFQEEGVSHHPKEYNQKVNTTRQPEFFGDKQVWEPPIQRTVAVEGIGIEDLINKIANHYEHLSTTGELSHRNRMRLKSELDVFLRDILVSRWREHVPDIEYDLVVDRLTHREISPWKAAELLINN